jgi:uncharacterized protein (DUF1015 family)
MADLHPFRALRPPAEKAAKVASVPYDVISTDEARELAKGNPQSFLHVIRPEIDLPEGTDLHSDAVYVKGRENLERFVREVPFRQEQQPSLFVYRLRMGGRDQTGVVGCCSLDDYDQDRIRKHERTRKDKEDDRTRHLVEMSCQAEPIFLTYRDREEIDRIVADVVKGEPLYDFEAADGVRHTLFGVPWPIDLVDAFRRVPLLYVADGHHRSASASRARAHFRDRNPGHTGQEEYNRVLATLFPAGQLQILPYNRVVGDLNSRSPETFLAALRAVVPLHPTSAAAPSRRGEFRLCLPDGRGAVAWYAFHLEPSAAASAVAALDVNLLQTQVLAPLLDIDDPRTSTRIDFVGGIRGTAELERLVRSGKAAVAFSLYPTSLDELMLIADAGEIMPPKSTWFEPKLRSGLFLHQI